MKVKGLFLRAYKNEVYGDVCFNRNLKTTETLGFKIIKPHKLKSKLLRRKRFWSVIVRGIIFVWPLINFIISTFYLVLSIVNKVKAQKKLINGKNIYLDFSGRLESLSYKVLPVHSPDQWISLTSKRVEHNYVSIHSLTSVSTIFRSYLYSLCAPFWLKDISSERHQYLLSYSSFNWFLTHYTLRSVRFDAIFFANHYDRWAVLFDSLNANAKTIIQHGILSRDFNPPVKLQNIDILYAFNDTESQIFFDLVIYKSNCKVLFLDMKLKFSIDKPNSLPTILFISCLPITYFDEIEILQKLPRNIIVYIKTHPVFPSSDYFKIQNDFGFELLMEKEVFPNVDLVISYNSTLGFEYEMSGIEVIYYEKMSNDEIVDKILTLAN